MHTYLQAGNADFVTLEKKVMEWGEPSVASGKQVLEKKLLVRPCCHMNKLWKWPSFMVIYEIIVRLILM